MKESTAPVRSNLENRNLRLTSVTLVTSVTTRIIADILGAVTNPRCYEYRVVGGPASTKGCYGCYGCVRAVTALREPPVITIAE
jgi:hypothetical protein